jgi:hypothetical protein
MSYRLDIDAFWDELDEWRKELRKHKDYRYLASVSFYVGRGTWNIRCNGILSMDAAKRIERRAKKFFPECVVTITNYIFYTVKIYF